MAELGMASRREADEWIERGWVRVDGRVVNQLGSRVQLDQKITLSPQARREQARLVTVLLHKPEGYVSAQAEDGHQPAMVLVTAQRQWPGDPSGLRFDRAHLNGLAPAGRLDLDSEGLLVLTQDGRIARQLIGQDNEIEKEYHVQVRLNGPDDAVPRSALPANALDRLRHGLVLDEHPLRPAHVWWISDDELGFVLTEGRKRQVRRMCEQVGLAVYRLRRVRIGRIALGDLPPGQWRYLAPDESFS